MDDNTRKYYNTNTFLHSVTVFHLKSLFLFMKIRCTNCKLEEICKPVKHKREICKAAQDTEKFLLWFTRGRNNSFASDDFFVYTSTERDKIKLSKKLQKIQEKYLKDDYVRE